MSTSIPAGRTQPFATTPPLSLLRGPYPLLDEIRGLGDRAAREARHAFVRLWLTEGIPFAFQDCPAVYEDMRGWLGARLGVHPKEVTLLGSARLGFSLGGRASLGRPFGPESDFDFSVVSSQLFTHLRELFGSWARDYEDGTVRPRHERERRFWDGNLEFGRRNLPQGFFDAKKIPTLDRYPLAQRLGQDSWVLVKKLEQTIAAPVPTRASIRVYESWRNLIERVSLNLYSTLADRAA